MDSENRDKLSQLVEELTTSGEPTLNAKKMKEVKKISKISNDYIEHLYHLLITQLNQEHAEIRLSAFHIVAELFSRSHYFRVLLVANLQEFLDLTVETDIDQPLPPPKEVAQKLKRLAIQTVQTWHATYGEAYKKLALGFHFLKQVKKVDFQDVEARTLTERRRQEERQRRLQMVYKEKLEKAKSEMEETREDIEVTLTEILSCMKLLLPDPENFNMCNLEPIASTDGASTSVEFRDSKCNEDVQPCCSRDLNDESDKMTQKKDPNDSESETEESPNESSFLRNSGVMSHKYSLELSISDVDLQETADNEAVLDTVKDLHLLITTKYLPAVQSWIQVFTRAGGEEQLLRQAVELKHSLESALQKHKTLNISQKNRHRRVMRGDESDDDFEEVPEKEGFEPQVLDDLRAKCGLEPLISPSGLAVKQKPPKQLATKHVPLTSPLSTLRSKMKACEEEQDPTSAAATLRILRQRLPSTVTKDCGASGSSVSPKEATEVGEEKEVPVVPFGIDLYYWGKEQPTAGKIIKYSSQHQFWVPNEREEEVVNEELSAQMKSRYITFAGRFQPVLHKCKAPMSNGGLCERQDRVKCPFHGKIISRDDLGRPTNPEDAERLEKEKRKLQEEQPDWRDPELMREIEAATGEDLGSSKTFGKGKKGSKGKGKKRKYPSLTDLKQSVNTSRSRLEKKVFNKSSMRRVTDVMNKMDKRKHEKFSNQFNYALN
ncbi:UV-stimulated scaffold protein A [Sardina pilchardus]|uniref:UV-stimulated scaffold protein A n=1 Tax=Sardina pilchardus TaxID=27697 RepID=UPI002E143DB4